MASFLRSIECERPKSPPNSTGFFMTYPVLGSYALSKTVVIPSFLSYVARRTGFDVEAAGN